MFPLYREWDTCVNTPDFLAAQANGRYEPCQADEVSSEPRTELSSSDASFPFSLLEDLSKGKS